MNSIQNYVRVRFSQFKALLRGSALPPSLTTVDSAAKSTAADKRSAKSTTADAKNLNLIGSTWNHVWSGAYHLLKNSEHKKSPEPVHADPPVLPEPVDDAPVLPKPVHADPQVLPVPVDDDPVLPEPVHADLVKSPKDSGDREGDSDESEGDNDDSSDDESESDFD